MTGTVEVLRCSIGDVQIVIETHWIDKVVLLPVLHPAPQNEEWLLGNLNYHGEQIPVIDMSLRVFGSTERVTEDFYVVFCKTSDHNVGLLAADTEGVTAGESHWFPQLEESSSLFTYVLGIVSMTDGDPMYLLGVDRIAHGLVLS